MKINTKDMILVSLFTALTAAGAFIRIPINPTPITLQFLFTALSGVLLGSKLGALSQIIYVVLGLIGIPIFTKPGGPSYIFQPSFGYLLGLIISAYFIGRICERDISPSFKKLFLSSLFGLFIDYLIGAPYMYLILNHVMNTPITISDAINLGVIVFFPGDAAKCIATAIIGVKVVPAVKQQILAK